MLWRSKHKGMSHTRMVFNNAPVFSAFGCAAEHAPSQVSAVLLASWHGDLLPLPPPLDVMNQETTCTFKKGPSSGALRLMILTWHLGAHFQQYGGFRSRPVFPAAAQIKWVTLTSVMEGASQPCSGLTAEVSSPPRHG